MPYPNNIFVHAPLAGVRRETGHQRQPPFSTIESVNFWPKDAITGRAVLATRPPLNAVSSPGSNINFLQQVSRTGVASIVRSMVTATGGDFYYWNGSQWVANADQSVTTGRVVYGTSFLQWAVILNDTTPIVYDGSDDSIAAFTATDGTTPADCRVAATWRGGIWMAGAPSAPHIFYGSRTGDIFDWDFSQVDQGAAFQATGEDEGLIAEPITALVAHTEDTMVIGSATGLWALRGHPRRGGSLGQISSVVGIAGQGAWTKAPDDTLFMMTKNGMYGMPPYSIPAPMSSKRIPDDLIGLAFDSLDPVISMAYDTRWNGIHISVRGEQEQLWFFDMENKGFWQMDAEAMPTVMMSFDPFQTESSNGVLYGGTGYGGLAQMDTTGEEDTGYYAVSGPIALSENPVEQGRVLRAQHVFTPETDVSSGVHTVAIRGGVSPNDVVYRRSVGNRSAYHAVDMSTLLMQGGTAYPSVRGNSLLIEIAGSGSDTRLSYEGTGLSVGPAGTAHVPGGLAESSEDTSTVIDTSIYRLYAAATPQVAPGSTLTQFSPWYIDLSRMPDSWWAVLRPDGGDIRVTTATNTLLPGVRVKFNKSAKTGFFVYKGDAATTPVEVRVWAGSPLSRTPSKNAAIGQYNAFSDDTLAYYPNGAGEDLTRNKLRMRNASVDNVQADYTSSTFALVGDPAVGADDALLGVGSTLYATPAGNTVGDMQHVSALSSFYNPGAENVYEYAPDGEGGVSVVVTPANEHTFDTLDGVTLFAVAKMPSLVFDPDDNGRGPTILAASQFVSVSNVSVVDDGFAIGFQLRDSPNAPLPAAGLTQGEFEMAGAESAYTFKSEQSHQTAISADAFVHIAGASADPDDGDPGETLFVNGAKGTNTAIGIPALTVGYVGVASTDGIDDVVAPIAVLFAQVDLVRRSDDWIQHHAAMFDQATFWGTWETVLVNV